MIQRTLAKHLKQAAGQYPVVTLTGPRQSGKTTLVRAVFPGHAYISLEDPEQRAFALEDPRGFLGRFPNDNLILDEAQRAPELFSYIQVMVDRDDRPGHFILSGSQNFLLLKNISQTLAGRAAIHYLLPFSLAELTGDEPLPHDRLGRDFPKRRRRPDFDLNTCLFRGFYPRIHDKGLGPQDWLKNYYRTYVERDVREIVNIGDTDAFQRFVALCAGRSGQLLNFSSLAADCGITHTTARRWLSVLQTGFIVTLLRPHHKNFRKRLVKSPKLYFLDTGLLCYLLRIRKPQDLAMHAMRGPVFETFVVAELFKKALHTGRESDFFFWRDATGHEVDVIIDLGEEAVPLEIKSGATVARDFFKGLNFWRKLAGLPDDAPSALIYGGDQSYVRNGVHVYSWWNV